MNEYEKQRLKRQLKNETLIKQMQNDIKSNEVPLDKKLKTANDVRSGLGNIGQALSTSENAKLANAGSKLYKFTGQQGLDTLKNKAYNGIDKGVNALKGNPTGVGTSIVDTTSGANTATSGLSNAGQTASNVTSGANTASTVADGASKASTIANGAGKVAGAVGGAMNAVDSATKFAKGDAVGGGLSALKLASLAGGPIGWGVYALATIAEMFKGAQDKKRQKALSQTQEANAEAMMKQKEHQAEVMQDNAERKAEAVGEIESGTDVNSDMTIEPVNVDGQQNDINTPIAEETPVNEPANDVSEDGENKTMKDGILSSLKDFATGFLNHEAGTTGGASPIDNIDLIADQEKYMRDNKFAPEHIKGLRQGLNYGNAEIADWIDQYNKGAGRKDPIKIPQTEQEIELAKAGKFNPVPQEASVDEKKTLKDLIMQNIGDSLGGFAEGYRENRNNGFNPDNLVNRKMADGSDKTFLNRAGEAVGTLNRLATNPLLQGGLAGLAYGIDKGDALYGLGKGVEWAGNKAKSNMYADKMGLRPGVFDNYTSKDYEAVAGADIKRKKYIQTEFFKAIKEIDDLQKNNQISKEEYDKRRAKIESTFAKYALDSALSDMPFSIQESNQTRMTNVAEGNLGERVRHNKVAEGQGQQRINQGIQEKADKEAEARQMNNDVVFYATKVSEEHKPAMLQKLKDKYPNKFPKILEMINDYENTTLPGSRKR